MNVDTARFSDAVAIQLPLAQDAPFTMGAPNQRVQILHWKALWQKDVDEHFQDVQDLHPNYWTDLYWFAKPISEPSSDQFPYRVPDSFSNEYSHQWFPPTGPATPWPTFIVSNRLKNSWPPASVL